MDATVSMSTGGAREGAPQLRDGEALDQFLAQVERWAKKYPHPDDRERADADYDSKFTESAHKFAGKCTPKARSFAVVDWIAAILMWLIVAGIVLAMSILLMQPDMLWFWIFVGVAVAIFVIGVGYVYYDTTSPAQAERKLDQKAKWLLGAGRKQLTVFLDERTGA